MKILAVDPGLESGYAVFSREEKYDDTFFSTSERGELKFLDEIIPYITRYDAVICEDYIVNKNTIEKSRQNYSLEIIGALRYSCHFYDIQFVLQTPAQAKSFATNDKLKKLGWFSGGAGHADDAARHLLVYCVNNKIIPIESLI